MTRTAASAGKDDPDPVSREPRFVGRIKEMTALREVLTRSRALVLVEGEAGIGKSRLLAELLAGPPAGRPGGKPVVAACPPFRQPQTLGPLVDAVRQAADDVAGLRLSPLGGALRSVLPEWAQALPPALEPAEDATAARHRLFRALAELLDRLDVRLVVVEDAHWADEATLEFLLFLVAAPPRPVSLVVSYRPEDVPDGSLLRQLSSRRPVDGVVVRVSLGALDVTETAQMVSSMLAEETVPEQFARFMHERTDGVPLAIEESLRLMVDRADLARRNGEVIRRPLSRIDVPPTIRDAVLERASRLSDQAQAALRALAVLAEPESAAVVAAVARLDATQAQAGLAEVVSCGLAAEDDGGRAGFRHMLASQALYEAIPGPGRQQLHQRAGEILEGRWQEGAPMPAMRLVRHFRESGDAAGYARHAERAADLALAAGDELAVERLLYDLLSRGGLSRQVLVRLTSMMAFILPVDQARSAELIAALRSALTEKGLGAAERAVLHLHLGRALLANDYDEAGRAELEKAVRGLPAGSEDSVRVMITVGWPIGMHPASVHRRWLRRATAATAAMTGARRHWAAVEHVTALLLLGEQSGWAAAARLPDDTRVVPGRHEIARAALNLSDLAITWGHYEQAGQRLATAVRVAGEYGYERVLGVARVVRAHLDWFTGAWAGLADRAAGLAEADDIQPMVRSEAALICGLLHDATGDHALAQAYFEAAISCNRQFGAMQNFIEPTAALARLRLTAGDVPGALDLTDEPIRVVTVKGIWIWAADLAPVRVEALIAAAAATRPRPWSPRWRAGCAAGTPRRPAPGSCCAGRWSRGPAKSTPGPPTRSRGRPTRGMRCPVLTMRCWLGNVRRTVWSPRVSTTRRQHC